jgi:hypothetical protein
MDTINSLPSLNAPWLELKEPTTTKVLQEILKFLSGTRYPQELLEHKLSLLSQTEAQECKEYLNQICSLGEKIESILNTRALQEKKQK